jgi:hypothetical membrane protein
MLLKKSDIPHLPGILIAGALQFFMCEFLVAGSWRGYYSYSHNFISDLGVPYCGQHGDMPCSSSAVLMNISLFVFAAALLVGAWWIDRSAPLPRVGVLFLALAAAGAVLVGLIHANTNWALHSMGASMLLIFGGCAALTYGLSDGIRHRNVASVVSAPLGVLALAGYFCYDNSWQLGLGPGGIERVSAYSVILGFVFTVAMISSSRRTVPGRTAPNPVNA